MAKNSDQKWTVIGVILLAGKDKPNGWRVATMAPSVEQAKAVAVAYVARHSGAPAQTIHVIEVLRGAFYGGELLEFAGQEVGHG